MIIDVLLPILIAVPAVALGVWMLIDVHIIEPRERRDER